MALKRVALEIGMGTDIQWRLHQGLGDSRAA